MSKLYIVATPIGNLEDMTLRAIRVLKEVDLILCEDTRVTGKLLKHYKIETKTHSFNAHASEAKFIRILEILKEGKNIALVTDAGTPAISDPGSKLVEEIKNSLNISLLNNDDTSEPNIEVITIPGPSALTAALSISGVPASEFTFLGFLPHKKGRKTLFMEMAKSSRPYVFYESPHRILKTLDSLKEFAPNKTITIAKELTKIYENVIKGTGDQLIDIFKSKPELTKGEFVIIVS